LATIRNTWSSPRSTTILLNREYKPGLSKVEQR
jgi:hypothetical protein